MSTSTSLVFNLASLTSHSMADINSDHAAPHARPGSLFFAVDAFGPRIFMYGRNRNGSAVTQGETMAYEADGQNVKTTTVSNITAGSTTSATTSSLTANDHDGKICFVLDNADSAGAAPEAESGIVANNTATLITLEADYAMSTALAANDDLELIANWQFEDAADGDENWTVAGVVMGADGITAAQYGWLQIEGPCHVDVTTNAISEGDPVVTGANIMDAFGTDGQELWTGIALASGSTDESTPQVPVWLKLLTGAGPGGSP